MFLNDLNGCELVSFAAILAIYISQGLTADEIDTLGNFFSALGSNLSTIATAQAEDMVKGTENCQKGRRNLAIFIKNNKIAKFLRPFWLIFL